MNKYDPIDPKRLEPRFVHISKHSRVVPGELPGDLPRTLWSRGQTFRHAEDTYRRLRLRGKSALRRAKDARMAQMYAAMCVKYRYPAGVSHKLLRSTRDTIMGTIKERAA